MQPINFICECSKDDCDAVIPLLQHEYRALPGRTGYTLAERGFLTIPEHREGKTILASGEGWTVSE